MPKVNNRNENPQQGVLRYPQADRLDLIPDQLLLIYRLF